MFIVYRVRGILTTISAEFVGSSTHQGRPRAIQAG